MNGGDWVLSLSANSIARDFYLGGEEATAATQTAAEKLLCRARLSGSEATPLVPDYLPGSCSPSLT